MNPIRRTIHRPLAALCLAAGLSATAQAAVDISGALSDSGTGPLTAGVYHAVSHISVPAGETLTVHAGAIIKFTGNYQFDLDGTLVCNGTAGNEVIFTSVKDDTAGGDTNGDGGATTPAGGDWRGILVHAGAAASDIDRTIIRYAGGTGYAGLYLAADGANITVTDSRVENCNGEAINMFGKLAYPTVTGTTFSGNGHVAVGNCRIDSVPGFANNSASGNGGDYIEVTQPDPVANVSIQSSNCLNDVLVFTTYCDIPSGVTLSLGAGVVVKFSSNYWIRATGTLSALGTVSEPVVFTSLSDDDHGGDTNKDGVSSGSPGAWRGLVFDATGAASVLDRTVIRYAGGTGYAGIYLAQDGADITVTDCRVENCSGEAIDMQGSLVYPAVTGTTFTGNGDVAVGNCRIDSVPGFSNNSASGNAGDYIEVAQPDPVANVSIQTSNCLNDLLVFTTYCDIPAGVTLSLGAGVVVKFWSNYWIRATGTLSALGTASEPVVFTSFLDDDHGGDTNKDGASSGTPGAWRGLVFDATGAASVLDHAVIRYAGGTGYSGIYLAQSGADITVTDCRVENCSGDGMNLLTTLSYPTVTGTVFTGNGGVAVGSCRIDSVQGFDQNGASGNAGNYMKVTYITPSGDVEVQKNNCLNGALVFTTHGDVPDGTSLTLGPGVVVKLSSVYQITATGKLDLLGNAYDPVVFTAFADDEHAGDTNGDGSATLPSPGAWRGLRYLSSATAASTVEHVLLRYTGGTAYAGLVCDTALLSARSVRVEHAANDGFLISDLGEGANWAAFDCATNGIELVGGSFTLRRVTGAGNAGSGIFASAGFAGLVESSVAWGNLGAGGNIAGLDPGELEYSNGSPAHAGANGNIDSDPLFTDLGNGDLTPLLGSPCIDAGDPSDQPADQDFTTAPRFLDGDLDRAPKVDMGAYEFDNVRLLITGNPTPGGAINITTTGTAGLNCFMFVGEQTADYWLYFFGNLYVDVAATYTLQAWGTIPSVVNTSVPLGVPTPLPLVFQQLALTGFTSADAGNFSNPVRMVIQ